MKWLRSKKWLVACFCFFLIVGSGPAMVWAQPEPEEEEEAVPEKEEEEDVRPNPMDKTTLQGRTMLPAPGQMLRSTPGASLKGRTIGPAGLGNKMNPGKTGHEDPVDPITSQGAELPAVQSAPESGHGSAVSTQAGSTMQNKQVAPQAGKLKSGAMKPGAAAVKQVGQY